MSKRKREYFAYLDSGHWKSLRQEAFKRDGGKCSQCGSGKRLCGHHKRYRKNLRLCTVDDIQTMCEKCHVKHHKEVAAQRRLRRKTRGLKARRALLSLPIELVRSVRWES